MIQRNPCSPYLLKPLRSFEEAERDVAARRGHIAAAKKARDHPCAPAAPPTEVEMKPRKLQEAERKKAWDTTKKAVGAYAKNPCAATEVQVATALKEVNRVCRPCAPARNK